MKTLIAILLLGVAFNSVSAKDPKQTSFLDLGNPVAVTKPAVINDKDKTLYRSILTGVEAEILKAKLPAGDQPHGLRQYCSFHSFKPTTRPNRFGLTASAFKQL